MDGHQVLCSAWGKNRFMSPRAWALLNKTGFSFVCLIRSSWMRVDTSGQLWLFGWTRVQGSLVIAIAPFVFWTGICYGTLNTNNFLFYFILFYFFWFYFSFSLFYFPGKTMKKTCDKEVTWQVTWCDIIGLEHSRRVWKMMTGHLEYIWWPWVRSEVDMRMKHGL